MPTIDGNVLLGKEEAITLQHQRLEAATLHVAEQILARLEAEQCAGVEIARVRILGEQDRATGGGGREFPRDDLREMRGLRFVAP